MFFDGLEVTVVTYRTANALQLLFAAQRHLS